MPKTNNLYNDTIEKHLSALITGGTLRPGDRLPSERELARQFNTSNTPVRQATDILVAKGLLIRIPGKGTFIKEPDTQPVPTGRLAVLYLPDYSNFFSSSFYSKIFEGVEREANARHKDLILRPLQRTPDEDPAEVIRLLEPEADAFILIDLRPRLYARIVPTLRYLKKPVILVNYEDVTGTIASVTAANVDIAREMVTFLIRQGHTRIGFAAVAPSDSPEQLHPNVTRRMEGYRLALLDHNLPHDDSLIVTPDETGASMLERCTGPDRITALYFPYDTAALVFLKTARAAGLHIPEDVSVTGSLDIRESRYADPPLTSVAVPLPQLGIQAVRQVLDLAVPADGRPGITVTIPGELQPRASHGTLK